jgi:predicted membrane-bound mannosyltransferase
MTEHKETCCTSPAAVCYWFTVSLVAWGVLSLIGIYWHPLHALSPATTLFAIAIGCAANWRRNRTLHCAITGPLFLIAGLVFLLSDMTETHVNSLLVWPFVAIGVGIAFLLEWRYTRLSAS